VLPIGPGTRSERGSGDSHRAEYGTWLSTDGQADCKLQVVQTSLQTCSSHLVAVQDTVNPPPGAGSEQHYAVTCHDGLWRWRCKSRLTLVCQTDNDFLLHIGRKLAQLQQLALVVCPTEDNILVSLFILMENLIISFGSVIDFH
jgi:hypothetical protein